MSSRLYTTVTSFLTLVKVGWVGVKGKIFVKYDNLLWHKPNDLHNWGPSTRSLATMRRCTQEPMYFKLNFCFYRPFLGYPPACRLGSFLGEGVPVVSGTRLFPGELDTVWPLDRVPPPPHRQDQDRGTPSKTGADQGCPSLPLSLSPRRTCHGQDTPRAVCLLRSHRRTFLFKHTFRNINVPLKPTETKHTMKSDSSTPGIRFQTIFFRCLAIFFDLRMLAQNSYF